MGGLVLELMVEFGFQSNDLIEFRTRFKTLTTEHLSYRKLLNTH